MRSRSIRIAVLLVGALLALAGALFGLSSATADPVEGSVEGTAGGSVEGPVENPVTDLTIREEGLSLWSRFHVDLSWSVPDSTSAGDTFVLELPRQVTARTEGFDLRSPSGDVVARAEVADGVVTFTMTDFVDSHRRVAGSAYFEAGFVPRTVTPGETTELVFSTRARDFVVAVDLRAEATDNSEPRKYGYWSDPVDQGVARPTHALTWRVVSAARPSQTVVFDDRVRRGHTLDCDTLDVRLLTEFAANGDVVDSAPIDAASYTVDSCDADGFHLTAGPVPDGDALAVTYRSSVSDRTSAGYANQVTVVQDGNVVTLESDVLRSEAGGTGTGERAGGAAATGVAQPTGMTAPMDPGGPTDRASAADASDATAQSAPPDTGSTNLALAALAAAVLVAGVAQTFFARRRGRP